MAENGLITTEDRRLTAAKFQGLTISHRSYRFVIQTQAVG